jgi:Flp pilus assembly protein TadG
MLMNPCAIRRPDRRGMVTVLLAIFLIICLGIIAIALDGGMMMEDQRMVQAATDAAALAAATDLFVNFNINQGLDPNGTAQKSALTTAAANGFTTSNSTIAVNIPPLSGPFAGNTSGYAEVVITYNQQPYFSQIWGVTNLAVTSRSVARGQWISNKIGAKVLGSTDYQALNLTSSGSLVVSHGGSVVVNSNNPQAAAISGSGTVTAQNINITGGYVGGANFIGTVTSPSPPVPDFLNQQLQDLDPSDFPVQSSVPLNLTGNATLSPGLYVGGVVFSGGTLTLNPGIYYFQGGGVSITAGTLSGTGVLLYNGPGTVTYPAGSINIAVTGTLTLSPPSSGSLQGVSIWQDDSISSSVCLTFSGTNSALTGTIYFPKATLVINGTQNLNGAYIIGQKLLISGSGSLSLDPTAKRRNIRQIQLVE